MTARRLLRYLAGSLVMIAAVIVPLYLGLTAVERMAGPAMAGRVAEWGLVYCVYHIARPVLVRWVFGDRGI